MPNERKFEVPWGSVAAKCWGDPQAEPVLLLHGTLDSAGSFDRLIPNLPPNFYFVCLDLPGHGYSSHMPPGTRPDLMDYVLCVDRIVRQLKWTKFSIIGHSFGGCIGEYYAAMYPEHVVKLVVLDIYNPWIIPKEDYLKFIREMHENVLEVERKIAKASPPFYSYDDALSRVMIGRRDAISRDAAEPVMARNVKKTETGYYFTNDQRLKMIPCLPLSFEAHYENYRKIKCELLLILTEQLHDFYGVWKTDEEKSFIELFRKLRHFKLVVLDSGHDIHNIMPETVGKYISEFLLNRRSGL